MKHIGMISAVLLLLAGLASMGPVPAVEAHQPYCEDRDIEPTSPFRIDDPTVSTALYATLFPENDVDYLAFHGEAGQRILLGVIIPQIDGQEAFAPTFALFGPGLTQSDLALLPDAVQPPRDAMFEVFAPGDDPPEPFYEPFSGTSYWSRQETVVTLPDDGHYTVAVWHEGGEYGRYVMVVGDREILGGDIGCLMSLDDYFSPVDPDVEMLRMGDSDDHDHDDGDHHDDDHHDGVHDHEAGDSHDDADHDHDHDDDHAHD